MSEDLQYYATCFIGSLTAFSIFKVLQNQASIYRTQKIIKRLSKTQIKSPDDQFVAGQAVIVKGTVARNTKDKRNDSIVRDLPNGSRQDYVVYIKHKQAIYSNENFSNKQSYVYNLPQILGKAEITFNPSFLLKGLKNSIKISEFDQTDYSSMLEITRWDNKKRRLALTEKIQVVMLSYFRALGTLVISDKRRPGHLRGLDIGTREVESGLKVGASILALGTIGVNMDGELFMQPNFLFKDRLTIVSSLKDIVNGHESSRNFWLVVLLIGTIYVSRRVYKYQQKTDFISKIKRWLKGEVKEIA